MIKKVKQFWLKEANLSILLVVLSLHIFVIIPIGQSSVFGKTIAFIFYIFLMIAGLEYLSKNKKIRVILVLALLCLVFLSIGFFSHDAWVAILSDFSIIFYCTTLAWIVLAKTFSQGPITIYRIEGSIVVYLLIGLLFAIIYHLIFQLQGIIAFKGLDNDPSSKEFIYFSFVTLTTVGYGDITPAIPSSRSMANLEALVGQLYPAILIARLVSMEFIDRK